MPEETPKPDGVREPHTPGPWRVGARPNTVVDGYGTILANCEFSHSRKNRRKPTGKQSIANACLMAAAPELLAALRDLFALVRGEVPSLLEDDHHYELVVNAIIKAEGAAIPEKVGQGDG